MKRLFISHAEKDFDITQAFVELLYRIGLKESDIFCSSISELGVPIKEDIYSYLRNLLDSDDVIPIFMLSENYYSSAACLNEMGAVWLKQNDYYIFLLPGFTFKEIKGAINPSKRGIKLDNTKRTLRGDLNLFKEELCEIFMLKPIAEQRWEDYRDSFIKSIQNSNDAAEITFDIAETETFCIEGINRNACEVIIDKVWDKLDFRFDFNKTTSELCSLVLYTGEINLHKAFQERKRLEFWIKASDKVKEVIVEMHLSSKNPSKTIQVSREWQKCNIRLDEFTTLEKLWECCKEICFVVDRKSAKRGMRGVIEVKDIKIL